MSIRKKVLPKAYIKISKALGEGKLKRILRKLFYTLASSLTFGYEEVELKDGIKGKFVKTILLPAYYSKSELRYYTKKYELKKGDKVVDAGAYVGHFTIYAAKKVYPGKVICFEPDPTNIKILKKNIKLNNLTNVMIVKKALFDQDTKLFLDPAGTDSTVNATKKTGVTIDAVALDNELNRLGIKKLDFVKMDIEGAEIEAIKGCIKSMKDNNVNFAIATYHEVNGEKTYLKVEEWFRQEKYHTETLKEGKETTYAWRETK